MPEKTIDQALAEKCQRCVSITCVGCGERSACSTASIENAVTEFMFDGWAWGKNEDSGEEGPICEQCSSESDINGKEQSK